MPVGDLREVGKEVGSEDRIVVDEAEQVARRRVDQRVPGAARCEAGSDSDLRVWVEATNDLDRPRVVIDGDE